VALKLCLGLLTIVRHITAEAKQIAQLPDPLVRAQKLQGLLCQQQRLFKAALELRSQKIAELLHAGVKQAQIRGKS
jgi:hypothetical protein